MTNGRIGIIGGSGLYNIEGITDVENIKVETPFGDPSDQFITGNLEGKSVVFLPRHGKTHSILPSELNFRANIYGMKKLGVERIIAVSAVGSMKKEIKPLDIVIPDQFIDRTQGRSGTFFGDGIVGHVSLADPVCSVLADTLHKAANSAGAIVQLPVARGVRHLGYFNRYGRLGAFRQPVTGCIRVEDRMLLTHRNRIL